MKKKIGIIFGIIVLVAIIGVSFISCAEPASAPDSITYSGNVDGEPYSLTITNSSRAVYEPKQGDNYVLKKGGVTNSGKVLSIGITLTLQPSGSQTTFSITVNGNNISTITGSISWNDGSTTTIGNNQGGAVHTHNWNNWSVTHATCIATGSQTRSCNGCSETETQEIAINADAHNWVYDASALLPTCTVEGYGQSNCTLCGESTTGSEVLPVLGHSMGNWVITTPSTCTTQGTETDTCSREGCNHSVTRAVSTIGHNYQWVVTTPAGISTDGLETMTCVNCGTSSGTRVIPMTGTVGLAYTLINNGTAYSVLKGTVSTGAVVIPATYNGLPVTTIGFEAFRDCSGITSVTIPNSVTSIGLMEPITKIV